MQSQNIKHYANLESLVFANKMIENKQRFLDELSFGYQELEKMKKENIEKMRKILELLQ